MIDYFTEYFLGKYEKYLEQWTTSEKEVIDQQIDIQTNLQKAYPEDSENSLYFMISNQSGVDRVVYVGIAKTGLLMRFMNGNSIRQQLNNYIGDCRSYESKLKPNYTWRAKSAELRRRSVYNISWTTVDESELKVIEKELIVFKKFTIEGGGAWSRDLKHS